MWQKIYPKKQSKCASAYSFKGKTFVCKAFDKRFSQVGNLNIHLQNFAPNSLVSDNLKRHYRTHTKEKPFSCDFKRISKKTSLNECLWIHTEEKPFVCEVSPKGFCRKFDLQIHTNEKLFIYEICSMEFWNAGN